jgi:putative transposase
MIERDSPIPVKRQAQLLDLSRSSVYYVARSLPQRDLELMRILDELHLKWPFYGARKLTRELQDQGHEVGRRHVTTLMRRMGIEAIYRKPRTSIPAPLSATYPYLLTGLKIERPNHVWAADLTLSVRYLNEGASWNSDHGLLWRRGKGPHRACSNRAGAWVRQSAGGGSSFATRRWKTASKSGSS